MKWYADVVEKLAVGQAVLFSVFVLSVFDWGTVNFLKPYIWASFVLGFALYAIWRLSRTD